MRFTLSVYDETDPEIYVGEYECANPLELIEKGIELFKEEGGKVRNKKPEKGDMFLTRVFSNMDATISHVPSDVQDYMDGIRLCFTPPPEKEESEWEKLKERIAMRGFGKTVLDSPEFEHILEVLINKIDEIMKAFTEKGMRDESH